MPHTYREFHYASHDGLSLFCREYASANPRGTVICLPGLTRNSKDFTALAEYLAARYRVLTPDLRGRGKSQWDKNVMNYQPTMYYQDIVKLITDEKRDRVAIIGTSLGGILAMSLAATSVDARVASRIAGIVVNDIGPELAKEGATRIAGYVGTRINPGTWEVAAAEAKSYYTNAYPDFKDADWLAFVKATHREHEDGTVVADYDAAIGDAVRATSGQKFDLWEMWKSIKVPALVIRGARTDLLSTATFDRMLHEKPDTTRIEVPNRGHVPQLNEPGVREAIDDLLENAFA